MQRHWIFIGAISAAIAVGLGAFGAHGLEGLLADRHGDDVELIARRFDNWKTAALYQMHHSIGLILVGIVALFRNSKWLNFAGWFLLAGIMLFSGFLYLLVLTESQVHWSFVPLGGLCFIVGWIALAIGGCCLSRPEVVELK